MLLEKCAKTCLSLLVFCVVFSLVDTGPNSTVGTAYYFLSSSPPSVYTELTLSSKVQPATTSFYSSMSTILNTGAQNTITTAHPASKDDKLEGYVVVIIAVSAAVAFFIIVLILVLCIVRRKRSQRIARERNVSYNNMNYESTVKFRVDENGQTDERLGSTSTSDPFGNDDQSSTKKSNNNPRGQYETVDLPGAERDSEGSPRKYENVDPRQSIKNNDASSAGGPYENVNPMAVNKDEQKSAAGRYEEVVLSLPPEKEGRQQTKNDKYYENVDLSSSR